MFSDKCCSHSYNNSFSTGESQQLHRTNVKRERGIFLTEVAGTGHWIAVLIVTRAGLVAVYAVLARYTGSIATGAQRRQHVKLELTYTAEQSGKEKSSPLK